MSTRKGVDCDLQLTLMGSSLYRLLGVCGHFPVLRQRAKPVHRAEKWAMADLSLALRSQGLELDQVQGRTDFTQARGGDVEITGGGQQAGMAEQTLDER